MWGFHKSSERKSETPERPSGCRSRARIVLIWIERVLLIAGLVLVVSYGAARIESFLASRAALKKFAVVEDRIEVSAGSDSDNPAPAGRTNSSRALEMPNVDFTLWGERRIKAYRESEEQSGVPLAVLRIPKIRLEAPLLEGTDEFTLNHAVGRIAGTARVGEEGNIGIAGHRDGFFRGLKDVGVGDAIELKTMEGMQTYIVDRIRIVAPSQVEVLRPTSFPSLTLVTCYPFYFFGSAPQRYIVTASLLPEKNGNSEGLILGSAGQL